MKSKYFIKIIYAVFMLDKLPETTKRSRKICEHIASYRFRVGAILRKYLSNSRVPFGVHFFSAQTGKNGNGWKYQYKANTIRGFQQVNQCSPWMNDYEVFSLNAVIVNKKRISDIL